MNIAINDEMGRLSPEIKSFMDKAANEACRFEFGEDLRQTCKAVEDIDAEIAVSIVSADDIKELNAKYRGIDKVTDVLSFPQFESRDDLVQDLTSDKARGTHLVGDVLICHDQAVKQSKEYGTGYTREIIYLFVHSILHLFGYDHEDEGERRIMRDAEEAIIDEIFAS